MAIECACSIDMDGDCYGPSFFDERFPKARKEHRCCECGEAIQPGETYEYVKGCWDGEFSVYKTCMTCRAIRHDYCCTWVYGELREAMWEAFDFDYVTGEARDDD
jgi:hypothetical protein